MNREEPVASRDFAFMALFEPADEGGYLARFPAIGGPVERIEPPESAG